MQAPTKKTFDHMTTLPPEKGIDYVASLLPDTDSQGNYFKQRGVVMLSPLLTTIKLRDKYYKEVASLSVLRDMSNLLSFAKYFALNYCIVKEIDEDIQKLIKTNSEVARYYQDIKDATTIVNLDTKYFEAFINYVLQKKPQDKLKVQEMLGLDFMFLNTLYLKCYSGIKSYITEIYNPWFVMSKQLGTFMYAHFKSINKDFLYNKVDYITIEEITHFITIMGENEAFIDNIVTNNPELNNLSTSMKIAIGLVESRDPNTATLHKMPENAIQQHSYAQQQWTEFFNV